jgi:ATP-dependent exoDNAse (exonuclease V) beta subunit
VVARPAIDPRLRGVLAHALLEGLDFRRPVPPSRAKIAALAAAQGAEPPPAALDEVAELIAGFATSPLCARLAAAGRGVRREAPFAFALESDRADGPLLSGFVDVLAPEPDGTVLIVDYKTDHLEPHDTPAAATGRAYATQRAVYALAALRSGAPRVEVAHCYLERPDDPAVAAYTAADAPALAEAIAALASGVVTGDYPVTAAPHRDLCATCPGRTALCSHPQEVTLRPAAA